MILGIGVDSIEISRVVKAMEKEHFVHRIFTEKERAEMEPVSYTHLDVYKRQATVYLQSLYNKEGLLWNKK